MLAAAVDRQRSGVAAGSHSATWRYRRRLLRLQVPAIRGMLTPVRAVAGLAAVAHRPAAAALAQDAARGAASCADTRRAQPRLLRCRRRRWLCTQLCSARLADSSPAAAAAARSPGRLQRRRCTRAVTLAALAAKAAAWLSQSVRWCK